MKVWDRAGIELTTPGSAVRLPSVPRHVTDWATWLDTILYAKKATKVNRQKRERTTIVVNNYKLTNVIPKLQTSDRIS